MTAANEVVSLGLKDAGYEYINSLFYVLSFKVSLLTILSRRLLVCQIRAFEYNGRDCP